MPIALPIVVALAVGAVELADVELVDIALVDIALHHTMIAAADSVHCDERLSSVAGPG